MTSSKTPGVGFLHGVASFDPLPDAVLIWTRLTPATSGIDVRLTPASADVKVAVGWQVSEKEDFSTITASGTFVTDASRDYTVTVDVTGLQPAHRYYYNFACGKMHSVTGITKTAAYGPLEEMIFATVSCANWAFGHFHVYDVLARVDNLDFVMHCGDYIYEYQKYFYPAKQFMARHGLRPKHACQSLEDYRQRYACYRTDPDLQELHRRVPMIAVWDDHEIADSAHPKGSEDHEGTLKEWQRKKHNAIQAHVEWVPVRGMSHSNIDLAGCHRTFQFGDLATLLLVENRIASRSEPIDLKTTEFYKKTAQTDPKEWDDEAICAAKADLLKQFADPSRTMIGPEQMQDVRQDVQESVATGKPWQILVSQTVFGKLNAPRLLATMHLQPKVLGWICSKALKLATNVSRAGKEGAELARMYLGMGKYGVPINVETWDGAAAERERVLQALTAEGSNPVVLAGDSHNAWAQEIMDNKGNRVGVEFDGPAVTSIGPFEDIYSTFVSKVGRLASLFPLSLFTPWIEDSLKAANPDTLQYCNLNQRGFVLCHVTRHKFHAEFHFVSNVQKKEYEHYCSAVFEAEAGHKGRLKKGVRYLSIDGEIPHSAHSKRVALLRSGRDISKQMHGW